MTDPELIIAVAEAKGWTDCRLKDDVWPKLIGIPPGADNPRNLPSYLTPNEYMPLVEEMREAGTLINIDPCPGMWTIEHEVNDEVVFTGNPSLANAVLHAYLAFSKHKTKEQDATD